MNDSFRNSVVNTSKLPPELLLLEALSAQEKTGSASNAILDQEARGQREFVQSEVMPVDCNNRTFGPMDERRKAGVALLSGLGFQLGDTVENDPIFQYAKLPAGWTKCGTDHDMWSKLYDERSRERVSIFYKAAHYDRNAHFRVDPFIDIDRYHPRSGSGDIGREVVVLGGGKLLKSFGEIRLGQDGRKDWDHCEELVQAAQYWADEFFPEREDPLAYWDWTDEQLQEHLAQPPKGLPV